MSIGSFARPNSSTPFAKNYGVHAHVWQRAHAARYGSRHVRAMYHAAEIRRLFLAEAVNDSHGGAVISLASATVAGGINRAETAMFIVHFDQANRPALFEFHVEAAAAPSRYSPSPNDCTD